MRHVLDRLLYANALVLNLLFEFTLICSAVTEQIRESFPLRSLKETSSTASVMEPWRTILQAV